MLLGGLFLAGFQMNVTGEIKADFGKRLRKARDAKRFSRQVLGVRLGVSPKTIQSWEMGRTFIENLSLIPAIERELEISISSLIDEATCNTGPVLNEPTPPEYGGKRRGMPVVGPLALSFNLIAEKGEIDPQDFRAVPVIKPLTLADDVAKLQRKDILSHTVIPAEWVPRGSVILATRMADSTLEPMIPHGSLVIIDRREQDPDKCVGQAVVMLIHNKGIRIRMLEEGARRGLFEGAPFGNNRRGRIPYQPEKGDRVIGRVVGVMSLF